MSIQNSWYWDNGFKLKHHILSECYLDRLQSGWWFKSSTVHGWEKIRNFYDSIISLRLLLFYAGKLIASVVREMLLSSQSNWACRLFSVLGKEVRYSNGFTSIQEHLMQRNIIKQFREGLGDQLILNLILVQEKTC